VPNLISKTLASSAELPFTLIPEIFNLSFKEVTPFLSILVKVILSVSIDVASIARFNVSSSVSPASNA